MGDLEMDIAMRSAPYRAWGRKSGEITESDLGLTLEAAEELARELRESHTLDSGRKLAEVTVEGDGPRGYEVAVRYFTRTDYDDYLAEMYRGY